MTIEPGKQNLRGSTAVFEARDRTQDKYAGVERRRTHRRSRNDRRLELRFDLDKPDRRLNAGRREDDRKGRVW